LGTSYFNIIKYRLHDNGSNINGRQNVQCINTSMKREREREGGIEKQINWQGGEGVRERGVDRVRGRENEKKPMQIFSIFL